MWCADGGAVEGWCAVARATAWCASAAEPGEAAGPWESKLDARRRSLRPPMAAADRGDGECVNGEEVGK